MATLNEVMTQTADAIREKTGKSEKIAPVNFAEEIKSISAGGGESTIEYLDVSGVSGKGVFVMASDLVKYNTDILPTGMFIYDYKSSIREVKYIGIDLSAKLILEGEVMTKAYFLSLSSENTDSIPRITKEQFYDLNA